MEEFTNCMHASSTYMEVFNNGREIGRQEGLQGARQEGRQIGLRIMLRSWVKRIKSEIPENVKAHICSLSMGELTAFADSWNEIKTLNELQNWLSENTLTGKDVSGDIL